MDSFKELLDLASSNAERSSIELKMEQLENQIAKKVYPLEQKNMKAATKKLE